MKIISKEKPDKGIPMLRRCEPSLKKFEKDFINFFGKSEYVLYLRETYADAIAEGMSGTGILEHSENGKTAEFYFERYLSGGGDVPFTKCLLGYKGMKVLQE